MEATAQRGAKEWERRLGREPWIYRPEMWRAAKEIKVARFRQILIWPLTLQLGKDARESADGRRPIVKAIEDIRESLVPTPWTRVTDLFEHATSHGEGPGSAGNAKEDAWRYAEFVYFHDFVQKMLFHPTPQHKDDAWTPFTLHRRRDIAKVEFDVALSAGECGRFSAGVERCNLYLFDSGAAVLALEIDFGVPPTVCDPEKRVASRPMRFADVQTFADHARRAYAPFFWMDGAPAKVPKAVRWLEGGDVPIKSQTANGESFRADALAECMARVRGRLTAPVAAHWRALLDPLKFAGYHDEDEPAWRQVVDERIPVMSFVSLSGAGEKAVAVGGADPGCVEAAEARQRRNDLWAVKRGDWIRFCYADEAGTDELPYSPAFVQEFEREACYDRFFPSEATGSSTRYLIAGFHFAVVGAGFFFDELLVHHFRRHYFQMGLMLHMEFAALLATSSRISRAVSDLAAGEREGKESQGRAQAEFRDTMIEIEHDFLQFVRLFHFTGLSNQIQPNELFLKWRHALGVDRIFADLRTEIETATQFALSLEQREKTAAQHEVAIAQREEASAASRLTAIATIGAVLGLAFSFLGSNILKDIESLLRLTAALGGFSLCGWLLSYWLQKGEAEDRWGEKTRLILAGIFCVSMIVAYVTLVASLPR